MASKMEIDFKQWLQKRKVLAQNLSNTELAQEQFGALAKKELERATIAEEMLAEYYADIASGEIHMM